MIAVIQPSCVHHIDDHCLSAAVQGDNEVPPGDGGRHLSSGFLLCPLFFFFCFLFQTRHTGGCSTRGQARLHKTIAGLLQGICQLALTKQKPPAAAAAALLSPVYTMPPCGRAGYTESSSPSPVHRAGHLVTQRSGSQTSPVK